MSRSVKPRVVMYERATNQSSNASPPNIMLKNSDGSSVNDLRVSKTDRSMNEFQGLENADKGPCTESTIWNSSLLSVFVVLFSEFFIAKYLIRFADLYGVSIKHFNKIDEYKSASTT
jgi:hypothetical protein